MGEGDGRKRGATPFQDASSSNVLPLTRRTLLGGSSAALVASTLPAYADADKLTINQHVDGSVTVELGPKAAWSIAPGAFGDDASIVVSPFEPLRRRITILKANWPGCAVHQVTIAFECEQGRWHLRLEKTGWPQARLAFSSVDLARFLDDATAVQPTAAMSRKQARALLQPAFGSHVRCRGEAVLALSRSNTWSLRGELSVLSKHIPCTAITLRRESADAGPLADSRPSTPARSSLVAEGGIRRPVAEIACGGRLASPRVVLEALDPTRAVVVLQQWGHPRGAVTGVAFAFKAWVDQDGEREGPFVASRGVYREARDGRGRLIQTVSGMIAEKDLNVATRLSHFGVRGEGPSIADALSATVEDGETTAFDVRCLLTHVGLALPNASAKADVGRETPVSSRLDFSSQSLAFTLAKHAVGAPSSRIVVGSTRDAGASCGPIVQVPLERAQLRVSRAQDLLSLKFRFKDLFLRVDGGSAVLAPKDSSGAYTIAPDGTELDTRAVLVVEFPPQHVSERVYFRQLDPDLPAPGLPCSHALDEIRRAKATDRAALRHSLQEKLRAVSTSDDDCWKKFKPTSEFVKFADLLNEIANPSTAATRISKLLGPDGDGLARRWRALPADQQIYLGPDPDLLDPDAASIAFAARRASVRQNLACPIASEVDAVLLGRIPDVPLAAPVRETIARRTEKETLGASAERRASALADALEAEKRLRDEDYAAFASRYAAVATAASAGMGSVTADGLVFKCPVPQQALPDAMQTFRGTAWYRDVVIGAPAQTAAYVRSVLIEIIRVQEAQDGVLEAFETVTQARLSGVSRLAFRIGEGARGVPATIPFSLEGLTDWSRFDLAVALRARAVYERLDDRPLRPETRSLERDPAEILKRQRIGPGASPATRFRDIRDSLTRPDTYETAIEIPARLQLSPSQDARFRIPRRTPIAVFDRCGDGPIPTQLWSATLEPDDVGAGVRAIWSPDLRPDVLMNGGRVPSRGPWAPWSAETTTAARERFRTGLDAYDRHELVLLSGTYGLPVLGRRDLDGTLTDASQFDPPHGYRLDNLQETPPDPKGSRDQSAIYSPQILSVPELTLSALGGSLDLETGFTPPAAARTRDGSGLFSSLSIERWRHRTVLGRDVLVEVAYKGFLFPLGIRASLVRLTERRFAPHPRTGRPTAYLIQRLFLRVGKADKRFPAIGQPDAGRGFPCETIHFITQRTPDLVDPTVSASTIECFEVDLPQNPGTPLRQTLKVGENGRITIECSNPPPGLMFWPRFQGGTAGDVPFQFTVDGAAGAVSLPFVFVDNVAANEPTAMELLTRYYNRLEGDGRGGGRRTLDNRGLARRYARERKSGDTTHQTFEWVLRAQGRRGAQPARKSDERAAYDNSDFGLDATMEGDEQPPFYPLLEAARIRLTAAERFVGRELDSAWARFDSDYIEVGFGDGQDDEALESYLVLDGTVALDMGDAGARSGALARPAMHVGALSRKTGVVGGERRAAVGGNAVVKATFNPATFLGSDYKILGIVSFRDLLLDLTLKNAPKLAEVVEYGASTANQEAVQAAALVRRTVVVPLRIEAERAAGQWTAAAERVSARTKTTVDLGSGLIAS